jgi:hypothetical protein
MNAAIVDTDVVSTLFKGDTRARAYRPHVTGRLLGISFMTLAELERWSLERDWALRRKLELGPRPRDSVRFGRAGFSGAAGAPGLNDGVTRREFRANLKENATAATAPLALVRLPLL